MTYILLVLALTFWTFTAQAATYYVDNAGGNGPGGSDSNSCSAAQNENSAKASLNGGVNCMSGGDTLFIRGGTYIPGSLGQHGTGTIPSGSSFLPGAVTVIAAYPGETVWLGGHNGGITLVQSESFIIFDGINIDKIGFGQQSAFFTDGPVHHIRVQNSEMKDANTGNVVTGEGMFVHGGRNGTHSIEFLNNKFHGSTWYAFYWGASQTLIEGNEIHDNGSYGIHLFASTANDVSDNIIRNNIFYGNGFNHPGGGLTCGLLISCGPRNIAYNNIIHGNGCGIQIGFRCHDCAAYNNTIYQNQGHSVQISSDSNGVDVRNNISVFSGFGSGIDDFGPSTSFVTNLCSQSGSNCAAVGDPQLVNPGGGNFALQSGSPAINTGTSLGGIFNTDYAGVTRPQQGAWDIGALEFVGGGGVTPNGNPIYLSGGGHGDSPSDGAGDVQSCINAENIATPKATLAGACACMNAVPGKELRIRGGAYGAVLDTQTCPILGGTSWPTATRITAHGSETVTFQLPVGQTVGMHFRAGQYITIEKIIIDAMNRSGSNGVAITGSTNHIRFVDSVIRKTAGGFETVFIQDADNIEFVSTTATPTMLIENAGTDGIGVYGAVDGLILDRVRVEDNAGKGVNLNVVSGSNANAFIARSSVHHNGTEGLDLGPGAGAVIQNSLFYRNNVGLRIRSGASTVRVDNANAANNTNRGFQCDAGATGVRWRNLITWNNGAGQNSILNNCGGVMTTNFLDTTNPLFTNEATDDYSLQGTSTAINAGTTLPEVSSSFNGISRPQGIAWDIGAYERDAGIIIPPSTMGPLSIDTQNSRYFKRPDGTLVFLAGAYDWDFLWNMVDQEAEDYLDFWVATGQNLIRAPTNDWIFTSNLPPGSAPFNTLYFDKAVERIALARSKGVYVQISILEHIDSQPFNDVPYIESYIRHVVDTFGVFENVLFEIGNELKTIPYDGGVVGSFVNSLVDVINNQQAVNGWTGALRRPVGISEFLGCGIFDVCPAVVAALKASPADFIGIGRSEVGQHVDDTPADIGVPKVSIVDSDHIFVYNLDHNWVWRTFMRGHNPELLDGNEFYPDRSEDDQDNISIPTFDGRMRIGDTRSYALRMNMRLAVPNAGITTTGYALANPGVQYLVYQPGSGAFNVTLVQGTYNVEWFNASTKVVTHAAQVTGNGVTTFTPPASGDHVLFLNVATVPPIVTPFNRVPVYIQSWMH